MIRPLTLLPLFLVVTLVGCHPGDKATVDSAPVDSGSARTSLDPRLGAFLDFAIADTSAREQEKRTYAAQDISFEQFIFLVYTRAIEFDTTPDNSKALAQLGGYLEEHRPSLSPRLTEGLEKFYAVKANQTFMRGMFLTTVRGLAGGR